MKKRCVLSTGNLPRGGLPRNSVDKITDRPDMTHLFTVDVKHQLNKLTIIVLIKIMNVKNMILRR